MKRTNLMTYQFGRCRRVYMDDNENLYFRYKGHLYGTYREYCIEEA